MAEYCPLVIDQGEDFTADIIWTDMFDEPVEMSHPCAMDIKASTGQVFAQLITQPDIPEGEIPSISVSTSMGLLQLHIPRDRTINLLAGIEYQYDLFVTLGDESSYGGPQRRKLLYGPVTVNKRTTRM